MCGEYVSFGDRLRERIRTRTMACQSQTLVRAGEIATVVDDARRARVDEPLHAVLTAARQQRACAQDVGSKKIVVAPPDAHARRDVENGFHISARSANSVRVVE